MLPKQKHHRGKITLYNFIHFFPSFLLCILKLSSKNENSDVNNEI